MTKPMVYACLMGGLRQTPHHTGELSWCGSVNLLYMRLHVRAAIPRSLANATHSIRPAALFGRALGTALPQPACSPEGHCLHTELIPNSPIRIIKKVEKKLFGHAPATDLAWGLLGD